MLAGLLSRIRPVDRVGPRTGPHGLVLKTPAEKHAGKGRGNWACWDHDEKDILLAAAERWAKQLPPGERKFTDYAFPPGYSVLDNALGPFKDYRRQPLLDPWDFPGVSKGW